jgi:nitrile hydratase
MDRALNGVHDMGGMDGFGPVIAEPNEPVFHERWEGVVRGIFEQTDGRYFNLDEFRRSLERMPPEAYLAASYYERWLFAIESILKEKGVVSDGELTSGRPSSPAPSALPKGGSPGSQVAQFKPGDHVVTRNMHPKGHTRLPRYARGKRGIIRRHYGSFPLPDSNAHGNGPDFQPCYAVEFEARELWGNDATAGDRVCIDLWESYLQSEVIE